MNRRVRKRLRDEAFEFSHRYLGVQRLPAGVPALIRAYVNGLEGWPEPTDYTLGAILWPYRRWPLLP
jgi:hypothetical protein